MLFIEQYNGQSVYWFVGQPVCRCGQSLIPYGWLYQSWYKGVLASAFVCARCKNDEKVPWHVQVGEKSEIKIFVCDERPPHSVPVLSRPSPIAYAKNGLHVADAATRQIDQEQIDDHTVLAGRPEGSLLSGGRDGLRIGAPDMALLERKDAPVSNGDARKLLGGS